MGRLSNEYVESIQETDVGAVLRSGREILLQAFNWESHKHDWWRNLESKVPDIAKSVYIGMVTTSN